MGSKVMELILWRHAEAEDGVPDIGRALTPKGHKQAAKMAEFLLPRLPEGARIVVSPAKRTQQTASALGKSFHTVDAIAPGASPHDLIKAAGWPEGTGCVLLVGHQPSLGAVAAMLLAGQEQYWSVKKGAVWWLSRRERDNETVLRLVIAPEHFLSA